MIEATTEAGKENAVHPGWEPFLKAVLDLAGEHKLVSLGLVSVFATQEAEGKTRLNIHSRMVMPDGMPANDAQNLAVALANAVNGSAAQEAGRVAALGVAKALAPAEKPEEKPESDA